ncbi:MAG: class I SAM-dependent methyltransferase, partial [Proteobacteria bacterium]
VSLSLAGARLIANPRSLSLYSQTLHKTRTLTSCQGERIDRFARGILFSKLSQIQGASLTISDSLGTQQFGDASKSSIMVQVHQPRTYSRIAFGGSVGTGESYWDGDWDCSDLTGLTRLFVQNRQVLNAMDSGIHRVAQPFIHRLHQARQNSESGSKKNIVAHYDLGNDFFGLFLDENWMYSSGKFDDQTMTLDEAQRNKNDALCKSLDLKPSDHLLEIGTGWGGFAIHAARNYGCRVTTTTISDRQYELARERIAQSGLSDQITLLKEDYRKLKGQYDHLVSIEMIEAVGLNFLDTYFKKCASLVKPGGRMGLQSILIRDQYYEHAAKNVDFIQTHIFPGSAIPSLARILASTRDQTDFLVERVETFGLDYARTIHLWSENLEKRQSEIKLLGYPDSLYRLWKYYFAYCEGGFLEKSISVAQITFSKTNERPYSTGVSS